MTTVAKSASAAQGQSAGSPITPRRRPGPTRAELLATQLAEAITEGRMPPGTALEEERLAAAHGVSRTPVREALRLLAATGLVEQRPGAARWSRGRSPGASRRCSRPWRSWRRSAPRCARRR
jgi:DNA-binding FadR family transcriptional regulator